MQDNGPIGTTIFLVGWVVAIVHVGAVKYVMVRLRERHHQTWVSLGSPSLFVNGNARNAYLVWRFIVFGAHRSLGDQRLDEVCRVDLLLQVIGTALICAATYFLAKHR